MSKLRTKEGIKIFYKDWGLGQPIVFSHGWPLTADAWDGQMLFFLNKGFRVIAHDRRGHGRSTQTEYNNSMDQYADDLAELIEKLDLQEVILVGHSTGGGEITRYVARHGTDRLAKIVLLGSVTPLMLKTKDNPSGLPKSVFDKIREGVALNRSQFYKDLVIPFYGYNRGDRKISDGIKDSFWLQGITGGIKGQYDCIREFSESDFTEDLKKINIPTLIIHGDDDQIVPIEASAMLTAKLVQGSRLKIYKDGSHGLAQINQESINSDLLSFIQEDNTWVPMPEDSYENVIQ